jgi:hypothetical protein
VKTLPTSKTRLPLVPELRVIASALRVVCPPANGLRARRPPPPIPKVLKVALPGVVSVVFALVNVRLPPF